mmetsp:Transcript_50402/g.51259  ORF Transcript_50402/g.51259 Transcript_50402/m.51259 type:complete len:433 (-) Transcript_50402:187-1485(-)
MSKVACHGILPNFRTTTGTTHNKNCDTNTTRADSTSSESELSVSESFVQIQPVIDVSSLEIIRQEKEGSVVVTTPPVAENPVLVLSDTPSPPATPPPPTTATTTSSISNDEDNTTRSTGSGGGTSGCPIAAIKAAAVSSSNLNRLNNGRQKQSIATKFINPSFVERLIHREQLSMEEISESIAPLLMAGLDTTAYQMSWFYLHMASSPDIQQKLATDLHTHLGGEDVTTKEQLDSLLYLKACIREAHRLTPTGAMQVKTLPNDIDLVMRSSSSSSDDDKTPNKNSDDDTDYYCTIKAGQRISLNLRGYPMDPHYVEAPHTYQPERFLPDAIAQRKGTMAALALDHPDFADAFGRGKRRCLGANVATAEMMILAARLLQDWEIAFVDDNEAIQSPTKTWKPIQKLMLRAEPYPSMTLVPRRENTTTQSTNNVT